MVDVEYNDMGLEGTDANVDYSQYSPFDNSSFFHTPCDIVDFTNQTQVEVVRTLRTMLPKHLLTVVSFSAVYSVYRT